LKYTVGKEYTDMNAYDNFPARPEGFDYDAALADLQEKIRRKKKAKNLLAHFSEEATRLNSIMEDRLKEYETEQEEAEAMRSATLTLLLYSIMGLKEQKLQKEESEALAAKAEYENAKAELDHVLNRQVELRAEIRALGNCERDYEEMVAEKKAWLMAKEATVNAEVEALEAQKAAIIRDSKELKEAMESGQYALRVARSVMDALAKAQYLSKQDTRAPHGSHYSAISATIDAVHDMEIDHEKRNTVIRLDNSIQTLGRYLQDFAAELKDVTSLPMEHLPTTRFGEGLILMDRWADGPISEIVVDVKLDHVREKMVPLMNKLTPIVEGLEREYAAREAACEEIDGRIREIVLAQS
jgi:DNA repair exonuclease SbcCD ATPase subunit